VIDYVYPFEIELLGQGRRACEARNLESLLSL
jgi:hypothetical protein